MPVRIYDISKKLGLENKEVLTKAKELGIAAARVASSSLDKITAEYLEQQLVLAHPDRAASAPVTAPAVQQPQEPIPPAPPRSQPSPPPPRGRRARGPVPTVSTGAEGVRPGQSPRTGRAESGIARRRQGHLHQASDCGPGVG